MGSFIVGGTVLVTVALAIRYLWKSHRAGKSCGCSGDCTNCHNCH